MISQRRQPELRHTRHLLPIILVLALVINLGNASTFLLVIIFILVIRVGVFTSFNLVLGGLDLAGDDCLSAVVQGSVFLKELGYVSTCGSSANDGSFQAVNARTTTGSI